MWNPQQAPPQMPQFGQPPMQGQQQWNPGAQQPNAQAQPLQPPMGQVSGELECVELDELAIL